MSKSSRSLYARLLRYIKPYWSAFILSFVANVVFASVDSYSTLLFKPILDKGFIGKDIHFLQMLPLMIIGLFLLRGVASFVSSYALGWIGAQVVRRFRHDLYQKFLSVPATFYAMNQTGKLLSKFTFNVEQVTNATGQALTTIVRQSFSVLGLLVVMFYLSWELTLIVFVIVPIVAVLVRYVTKRFRTLASRIQNAMGDLNHITEETILGHKEIKIAGAAKQQCALFDDVLDYNFKQSLKMTLTMAANTPVIQLIASLAMAFIIYAMFHHGFDISAGSFVSFLAAMMAILKPIKQLTQVNAEIQRGISAAESVFEVLDEKGEVDAGQVALTEVKGEIKFQDVCFEYAKGKRALHNLNLSIKAGETVAFVGHSGAGKTTIINLIPRLYNVSSGKVLIDGVDTQSLTLSSLRENIALVSQHVVLFDDTIFNNIALGNRDVTEARVIEAAKAANAWRFIQQLPEGLYTRVGENGMGLSGGQRQRIAIARAILKDAPILILDEATSALDSASERQVQKGLDNLKKGRTTLIVAHRLSTIEKADTIVVLNHGKIIESGTHAALMKQKGAYYGLSNLGA